MARWFWLGGMLCLLITSIAWATRGTVRTTQGVSFTGNIVRNGDGSLSVTDSRGIETRIDPGDVAVVLPVISLDDEFHARLSRLDRNDVPGRMDLANWASENNRPDLAEIALRQALDIQPHNPAASRALQGADRQMELDRESARTHAAPPASHGTPTTIAATRASNPATQSASSPATAPAQMLTDDEVNTLRQKELPAEDVGLRIVFRNNAAGRYLAGGSHDIAAFRAMTIGQQARAILASGDPALAADVRIVTDPPSLRVYRQRINTIITSACGSIGCHGGGGGGDFRLYDNEFPNAAYTNFYTLQTYSTTVHGVPYLAVDRTLPERSLILQFGLAADEATVAHPKVPGYRPRYRTRSDGGYQQVLAWINNDLTAVLPNYDFPGPADSTGHPTATTRAAAVPTAAPATVR